MGDVDAPTAPQVGVVVVTFNSADVVGQCLESLAGACAGIESSAVVVADNDSSDETVAIARETRGVDVVELGSNRGYAAGINAGVAALEPSEAIVVLNPDVRLAVGSVRRLLDASLPAPVGMTVPRLTDPHGTTLPSLRRDATLGRALGEALFGGERAGRIPWLGGLVTDERCYRRPGPVDWATGAAMLITRPCWDAVGIWDESFFLYSEEADYSIRARRAGFRIDYVPDAVAVHLEGDLEVSPHLWTIHTLNRVRLYGRDHGRLSTAAFRAAVALNEAIRAAAGREPSRAALRALLHPSDRPPELAGLD